MIALLEAVCVQHKQPKPFEFVNSVSNAAGFHVAQQLGLEGPNLFIGGGPRAWSQLLGLAQVDLHDGVVSQALLLVIDEQGDFFVQGVLLEGDGELAANSFGELSAGVQVQQLALN